MNLSKGFITTFSASFIWAISIVFLRFAMKRGESAYCVLFWITVLTLPFWIYIFLKNKNEAKKATKKDWLILSGMGINNAIFINLTEILALKYSPAMNFAFLNRSVIFFTFLASFFFLKEKLTAKKLILGGLIIFGSYLLITKGQRLSLTLGDIFTLIEAVLIAFGSNVLGKIASYTMSSSFAASGSVLIGVIPAIIMSYFLGGIVLPHSPTIVIILSLLSIIFTGLRFKAYKLVTASFLTMIFSFTPVFVAMMALPLLGESLAPIQVVGGLLIISAGVMVEKLRI